MNFHNEISRILSEYGALIYKATDESLDVAAKTAVKCLKENSPEKDGDFKKGFKYRGKKKSLSRYIGNSTTVTDKSGKEIPLINILEYSTTHGKPFVKKTIEENAEKIARAAVSEIIKKL